ncbi:MAG: hypothetical protein DMG05_07115 [Acidobacteria bacterium]|nr:MAG: hypothetical protein DMG05_07115 [Acidobacteriota bacterium]
MGWPEPERTTPKADALSPSQDVIFWSSSSFFQQPSMRGRRTIFRGAAHAACGGATKDEISPPFEGVQVDFEGVQGDVPPYDIVPS